MLADGQLSDLEIVFLANWLEENSELALSWPGDVIYQRVKAALAAGHIADSDRQHLVESMEQLVGGTMFGTGATEGLPTALPIDQDAVVVIPKRSFCFTGLFLFGTREACEKAVSDRGGVPLPRIVKKLNYLVIGTVASPDWVNSSHGRKIEKAVDYNGHGAAVSIVAERSWVAALSR